MPFLSTFHVWMNTHTYTIPGAGRTLLWLLGVPWDDFWWTWLPLCMFELFKKKLCFGNTEMFLGWVCPVRLPPEPCYDFLLISSKLPFTHKPCTSFTVVPLLLLSDCGAGVSPPLWQLDCSLCTPSTSFPQLYFFMLYYTFICCGWYNCRSAMGKHHVSS